MMEWKSHWVHANPSKRGEHRIVTRDGVAVYQKLVDGEWRDQPPMPHSKLLAGKTWRL
jgi:hypothetical protein